MVGVGSPCGVVEVEAKRVEGEVLEREVGVGSPCGVVEVEV